MLDRYTAIEEGRRLPMHWLARSVPGGLTDIAAATEDELREANLAGNALLRELRDEPAGGGTVPVERSLLALKTELAGRMLARCRCCERRCGVDRAAGERGYCGVGAGSRVSAEFLHMGEEPELVPSHTVFFSGCTFRCAYCQNWDIAMSADSGVPVEPEALAAALEEGVLQGSRNVNFVGGNPDPDLYVALRTVGSLGSAASGLPVVWNSNMYASAEAMRVLEGVVDVYLGDFRYGNDDCAAALSDVEHYRETVTRNFADAFGTAEVMVRHLVLPGHLECCTRPIMQWVGEHMPGVYFNLMFQYRPEYRAGLFPEIDRRLTPEERQQALEMAAECGLSLG